jgi:hypothetical protein
LAKEPAKDRISRIFADRTSIDEALQRAADEAFEFHLRLGMTVPVWLNGRVEWVYPKDIAAERERLKKADKPRKRRI